MSFDLQRVLESKRAHRKKLAALPVLEKLRLLDELRAAALTLRRASVGTPDEPGMVGEGQMAYRTEPKPLSAKAGRAEPKPQSAKAGRAEPKPQSAKAGRAKRRTGKSASA